MAVCERECVFGCEREIEREREGVCVRVSVCACSCVAHIFLNFEEAVAKLCSRIHSPRVEHEVRPSLDTHTHTHTHIEHTHAH